MDHTAHAIQDMADTLCKIAVGIPNARQMIISSLESLVRIAIAEHDEAPRRALDAAILSDTKHVDMLLARSKKK